MIIQFSWLPQSRLNCCSPFAGGSNHDDVFHPFHDTPAGGSVPIALTNKYAHTYIHTYFSVIYICMYVSTYMYVFVYICM